MSRDPGARPVTLRELVDLLRALRAAGTVTPELEELFVKHQAEADGRAS
jgi:hypothetical protein